MVHRILLVCGILSSVLYALMNLFIPGLFEGYDWVSQTVSELSAIGAPTRDLWIPLGVAYSLLATAFGVGIWMSGKDKRMLRVMGAIFVANSLGGLFWPSMQLRGNEMALTDVLHIVFSGVLLLVLLAMIAMGMFLFSRRFRIYSGVTLAVYLVFGVLTGLEAPNVAKNLPTPYIGIWERIVIADFMLWLAVLAVVLLRRERGMGNINFI